MKSRKSVLGVVAALAASAVVLQAVANVRALDSHADPEGENVQVAAIYGEDTRVYVPQFERPWAWIGRLKTDESDCTAYLANACTVITVGHCLRSKQAAGTPYYKNPVFFRAGEAPLPLQNMRAGDVYRDGVRGEWGFAQIPVGRDGKYLGEQVGNFDFDNTPASQLSQDRSKYCIAGYSADKDKNGVPALSVDPDLKFRMVLADQSLEIVGHVGDAEVGASGGPIFRCERKTDGTFDYKPEVFAMHVSSPYDPGAPDGVKRYPNLSRMVTGDLSKALTTKGFLDHAVKYVKDYPCFSPTDQRLVTHPSISGKTTPSRR